ncbi:c-type cytochrome [Sulfurovum sp.]|uniref:c-type cytochrome n=1 Tax=Sulfurovum sp. TaxID=1969726 RepID=UPI003457486B
MKKITVLSLVAAAVLFTACGEDAKKAAAEATAKATETVKDTAAGAADAAKEATANAVEATKEKANQAAEAVKEEAANAVDAAAAKATEVKEAAEQKAADAAQALKERAAATTEAAKEKAAAAVETTKEAAAGAVDAAKEAVAPAADNTAGAAAFAKCAGCHGKDGKTKALGKSEVIAGQSAADLEAKLSEYKAGTRNVAGMGMLMKGQVSGLSDADVKAVAEYISGL